MSDLNVEKIKSESRALRGTLHDSLADPTTGAIAPGDTVVSKFHGIYQQDDRDARTERRDARLEPLYQFMLRVRIPGGRVTRAQWQALDRLADKYANGTLRLTSRQAIQFHGISRESLRDLVRGIDAVGMDSLAACGDVNRNVMCHVQPELGGLHADTLDWAARLSAHLTPATAAWREIWIDGEKVGLEGGDEAGEDEPIYGRAYLPRKFKVALRCRPATISTCFPRTWASSRLKTIVTTSVITIIMTSAGWPVSTWWPAAAWAAAMANPIPSRCSEE